MDNISILQLKSPTTIEMTLTNTCNHKCLHCYNPWRASHNTKNDYFTKEELEIFISELKKNDIWHVTISGGEPLTFFDVLKRTTKEFDKNDIEYSINSNLTLINDEIAKFLKERTKFTNFILTSLPSINKETCDSITTIKGSYNKIIQGIALAKKYGIEVGINMVISQKNIKDLETITEFLQEFDIDYLSISLVIPPEYDSENQDYFLTNDDIKQVANKLLEINKINKIAVDSVTPIPLCIIEDIDKYQNIIKTSCSAGISRCTIDAQGNVFACSHESIPYGNIFNENLSTIWSRMNKWRKCENLNAECKICKYINICGGECRMHNEKNKNKKYKLNHNANFTFNNQNLLTKYSKKIDINQEYIICNYKERKEKFGSAIRINYNEYFLDKEIINILDYIKENIGNNFSINQIKDKIEVNENLYITINILEEKGIIQKK